LLALKVCRHRGGELSKDIFLFFSHIFYAFLLTRFSRGNFSQCLFVYYLSIKRLCATSIEDKQELDSILFSCLKDPLSAQSEASKNSML